LSLAISSSRAAISWADAAFLEQSPRGPAGEFGETRVELGDLDIERLRRQSSACPDFH
jgi:hypothetical protein